MHSRLLCVWSRSQLAGLPGATQLKNDSSPSKLPWYLTSDRIYGDNEISISIRIIRKFNMLDIVYEKIKLPYGAP